MIRTALGQSRHLGSRDVDAAVVRLVRELRDRLDEVGALSADDAVAIDNITCRFVAGLPKLVRDDLRDG